MARAGRSLPAPEVMIGHPAGDLLAEVHAGGRRMAEMHAAVGAGDRLSSASASVPRRCASCR